MAIQSPWGELEVYDSHVHFFSHRFLALLTSRPPKEVAAELGWQCPPEDPEGLAALWVNELKRHGVSKACLISSLPGDEPSVAAAIQAYPSRFRGCFLFDPIQNKAEELLAHSFDIGFRTVCLFPAMHRYDLAADNLDFVFRRAADRKGSAVFVHCGVLSVGIRKRLGLPSNFDMRFSNPIDLHSAALRYPNLKFIVPHFGAGYFREALMLASLCPNVYLDTSSSNSWMKFEGLDLRTVFQRTIETIGTERLLFGTDSSFFPRGWHKAIFDQQAAALFELGISAEQAMQIFSANLAAFD
jgi:uncharacterized protein